MPDKDLEIANSTALNKGRAVIKNDNVYYDIDAGEHLIERLLKYSDRPLSNGDVQQLNANTVIHFDQGRGGDTVYDASDNNRLSGTDGKTNADALDDTIDTYIERHLEGNDKVQLIFRGNASTDGQGRVDNESIAEARAHSTEAAFAERLQKELDERVNAGSISEASKNEILDYYNAVDENGARINTINIGSVYQYRPGESVDTTHRNAEIFMGHADGDRAVLETRYIKKLDHQLFNKMSHGKGVINISSDSGDPSLPKDAFKVNEEANTLLRTGHTDFIIENLSAGRHVKINFDANDDLASEKVRFSIETDNQEDIAVVQNEEKGIAYVAVDGKYIASIKLEGGASLGSLQIGANTPENGFEKATNVFTQEENMKMHQHAKETLGIEKYESSAMYHRVKSLGLDGDGLTGADIKKIATEFNIAAQGLEARTITTDLDNNSNENNSSPDLKL